MLIARRMQAIQESPTIALAERARLLTSQGYDVINLGVGEPDFPLPGHVRDAAIESLQRGLTRYTPVNGVLELRQAIVEKLQKENGLCYTTDQVTVGAGAKQVIFNALMATLDPGDEVLVPSPYWVSYPDMVRLCGGVPVVVPGRDRGTGLKLCAEDLQKTISTRTKWLVLNAPSNPGGVCYTAHELRQIADVLLANEHVHVLSDDIYEKIVFEAGAFRSILNVEPRLQNRTLIVNGFSKSHSMTGLRIGYGAGPEMLIQAMSRILTQSTFHVTTASQYAAIAALRGPQDFDAERIRCYRQRRDFLLGVIGRIPGLSCQGAQGAFYLYVDCAGCLNKTTSTGTRLTSDRDLCRALLDEEHLSVVPGDAFGYSPYFRLSYAVDMTRLEQAAMRLERFCQSLTEEG